MLHAWHGKAKQNVAQLENEVKRLREKLNVRIADFEDLQRSSEERRQQLAARDAEVRTLRDRLEELRKEFSARQIESEDKVCLHLLRQVVRSSFIEHRRRDCAKTLIFTRKSSIVVDLSTQNRKQKDALHRILQQIRQ